MNEKKAPTAEEVKAIVRAYFDAAMPGWTSASVAGLLKDEGSGLCERLIVLPAHASSGAAS